MDKKDTFARALQFLVLLFLFEGGGPCKPASGAVNKAAFFITENSITRRHNHLAISTYIHTVVSEGLARSRCCADLYDDCEWRNQPLLYLLYVFPDLLNTDVALKHGRRVEMLLIDEGNTQNVQDRMLVSFLQAFMEGEYNVTTHL